MTVKESLSLHGQDETTGDVGPKGLRSVLSDSRRGPSGKTFQSREPRGRSVSRSHVDTHPHPRPLAVKLFTEITALTSRAKSLDEGREDITPPFLPLPPVLATEPTQNQYVSRVWTVVPTDVVRGPGSSVTNGSEGVVRRPRTGSRVVPY